MLNKIVWLAPFALIVAATACGSASTPTTGEEEGTEAAHEDVASAPDKSDGEMASTETELRGVAVGGRGAAVGGRGVAVGGRGVAVGGRGVAVGGRGVAVGGRGVAVGGRGVAVGGRGVGVVTGGRRGWVNGRWAPGWGWSGGRWIAGGGDQFQCTSDLDCGTLGPNVAVCSFEPTIGLGECVGVGW